MNEEGTLREGDRGEGQGKKRGCQMVIQEV